MFDEVSLQHGLIYDDDVYTGDIDGFKEEANHALVFMLADVNSEWKQPIGYCFSKDHTKTIYLNQLLKNILLYHIANSFHGVGCICIKVVFQL